MYFFILLDFPIYLQSVYIHSNIIRKLCVEKRGRVEECSVAHLRDKRVKTLCGCREKNGTN
jgi:ribosomal protein L19